MLLIGAGVVSYYWYIYGRMIDEHLAGHIDQTTARIYAAPTRISVGQALSAPDLVSDLQMAGYGTAEVPGAPGWYAAKSDAIEIHPEADSYFGREECAAGAVRRPQHTKPASLGRWLLPGPARKSNRNS